MMYHYHQTLKHGHILINTETLTQKTSIHTTDATAIRTLHMAVSPNSLFPSKLTNMQRM